LTTIRPDAFHFIDAPEINRKISSLILGAQTSVACQFGSDSLRLLSEATVGNESKLLDLKSRGIKLSCVTEILQDNLAQCKELMKYFELFHGPEI
jgi:hypothetical protein